MTRYRFGGVNSPILGGLVHRLAAEQPQAQITHVRLLVGRRAGADGGRRPAGLRAHRCRAATPYPRRIGLSWREVSVDPVLVLLPEAHPLAARDEVRPGGPAPTSSGWPRRATAASPTASPPPAPGPGSPRARCTRPTSRGCVDLVEAGVAVALCQATFRPVAGLVTRRLAGTPLRWRLLLGWHPDSPAAQSADLVLGTAKAAYVDSLAPHPAYLAWLPGNPGFGVRQAQRGPTGLSGGNPAGGGANRRWPGIWRT